MKYLKLIRFQNLLLIAFTQLLFRYGFLKLSGLTSALADWQYGLLVLATVLIAAGGYIINDIFDQDVDAENKPKKVIVGNSISEAFAYNYYAAVTFLGVLIGFYLSNVILRPSFAVVFILIATLLYFYSSTLKQLPLVGNIVISIVVAMTIIIIGIFDIFPNTDAQNQQIMSLHFSILFDYAKFAFVINLTRELVKDIEDINGDKIFNMNTLPILFGVKKTKYLALFLLAFLIVYLLYYMDTYLMNNNIFYGTIYMLIFVIAPLLFCSIELWKSNNSSDFNKISRLLKLIMFFGILSITIITLNINHNVGQV